VRVVRRVDHARVYVSDPQVLFDALTERLGLPAGMPVTRVPGSLSGLVVLGNMFLEVIRPAPGRRVGVPMDQGAFGVVLEPDSTEDALAELDRRSIPHTPPFPDPKPLPPGGHFDFDPTSVPPYKPIMIGGVLGDRLVARSAPRTPQAVARWMIRIQVRLWGPRLADRMFQMMSQTRAVYVNEYHPQVRAAVDPERMQGLLDDVGGGRIGLTGVRELVVGRYRDRTGDSALAGSARTRAGSGRWQLAASQRPGAKARVKLRPVWAPDL